jgi:hypothetical protein
MLTPDSPLEDTFLGYLSLALNALSFFAALGAIVLFVLAHQASRKKGYLLLAVAVGLPLLFSVVSRRVTPDRSHFASPDDAEIRRMTPTVAVRRFPRVDLPLMNLVTCVGAFLLYRDERKSRPGRRSQSGAATPSA